MALSPYTQQTLALQFKNALKSYNTQYDIASVGTYWDVTANATGAVAKELADWVQQVVDGNIPQNASPVMLEYWAQALGLVARKTGSFATGLVKVEASSYPITIPAGSSFSLATLEYLSLDQVTLTEAGNITVEATQTGAEYNIFDEVPLSNSIGATTTSLGITGGTGDETDAALLARILLNISRRKTDGMLSDYLQRALELYPYVDASTVFVEDIVPIGVKLNIASTIQDFDTAAQNPIINEISLTTQEQQAARDQMLNYSTVTGVINIGTYSTQVVSNLIAYITTFSGDALTPTQETEVRTAIRKSLLQFGGDTLTRLSLMPEMPDYVEDYTFNSFTPIERTSILFDSINIGVISEDC